MHQAMGEIWSLFGSKLASILFMWAMIQRYLPHQFHTFIQNFSNKLGKNYLNKLFNPYIEVRFFEYSGNYMRRSEAFSAIEHYLSTKFSYQASKLKGDFMRESVVLKMDEYEEVTDNYGGLKLVWSFQKIVPATKTCSFYPASAERLYRLTFHRRHRGFVTGTYIKHVVDEGKVIAMGKRQKKLYTNCAGGSDSDRRGKWSHVIFEHPASFETLAMDPGKKKEIIDDLTTFRKGKEYYARIGKPWKRGYLLYGPPGTGKSTLIAAVANFLGYDIYDIELTAVQTNAELRKLLIGITSKSVVVIEDIDCSIDLTGQREAKSKRETATTDETEGAGSKGDKDEKTVAAALLKQAEEAKEKTGSKVTLSGLLNFIDGIWSASTGERLIIFTTNFVEKLDKALVRRGRMDMHIELSYCGFEGFKVLAKNYLGLESHESFDQIRGLLEETKMTPADVAENLMPKVANEDVDRSLERLIQALRSSKETAASTKDSSEEKEEKEA